MLPGSSAVVFTNDVQILVALHFRLETVMYMTFHFKFHNMLVKVVLKTALEKNMQ